MPGDDEIVFLFDVDNTLLDNDRFGADLTARLDTLFGVEQRQRFWALYEAVRAEESVADYLGALQRFRAGLEENPDVLALSDFLLAYPFAERLYPRALEALAHVGTFGKPAILSDGDIVFQPRKIRRSGLWDAVDGRVRITVHKESSLDFMERRFPAPHYVMIDDKPRLLAAMKKVMGPKLTTVFVRQGHYAAEAATQVIDPLPDRAIAHIGDLIEMRLQDFTL